jgi:hypothetical protein
MNPDIAFVLLLLALLAAISWRASIVLLGLGMFVVALHSQLGYW